MILRKYLNNLIDNDNLHHLSIDEMISYYKKKAKQLDSNFPILPEAEKIYYEKLRENVDKLTSIIIIDKNRTLRIDFR